MTHEKAVQLYRGLLRVAWGDGVLGRKERLMLDAMRDALHLDVDEAFRLETEFVRRTEAAAERHGSHVPPPPHSRLTALWRHPAPAEPTSAAEGSGRPL